MRKPVAAVAATLFVSALVASGVGAQQPPDDDDAVLARGGQIAPKSTVAGGGAVGKAPAGPNPYLALLPDPSTVDYSGWKAYIAAKSESRADQRALAEAAQPQAVAQPILVDEDEPAGSRAGPTTRLARPSRSPGSAPGANQNNRARILGELSPEPIDAEEVDPNTEDDGSIPLAGETGIGTDRQGITTSGTIGDGPHGSAGTDTGDFDFYAVDAIAGQEITASTRRRPPVRSTRCVVVFDADR